MDLVNPLIATADFSPCYLTPCSLQNKLQPDMDGANRCLNVHAASSLIVSKIRICLCPKLEDELQRGTMSIFGKP